MGGMGNAEAFEEHRDHLMAVAYRMLGSRVEAEDAVQEAWLRYASTSEPIRDLRGWLTTTTARICLDVLRSARVRREAYVGPWLPEPVVDRLPSGAPDPAERAAQTDQVSLALLVVLERLTAEQRVAFVLHDVFAVPFEEIGSVLGSNAAAARQLASRARRAVAAPDAPRHTADLAEQRRVLMAFLNAAESGNMEALLAVLAPDVIAMGDGGGVVKGAGRRPIVTADKVARFMVGLYRGIATQQAKVLVQPVLVNGALGMQYEATYPDGEKIRMVMGVAIADGRITGVFNQLNPAKLGAVPPLDS
jgi:RNA polymerase sigma-70 factor, ECF subfamily